MNIEAPLANASFTVIEYRKRHPDKYHKVYDKETVTNAVFPLINNARKTMHFPECFVLELSNATVVGKNGYVIDENHLVLEESYREWFSYNDDPLFKKGEFAEIQFINSRVAVIATAAATCYAHWMLDVIPRIKILQESKLDYDFLYVPKMRFPFQMETLKCLGIDSEKLILAKNNTCLKASSLLVPSLIEGQFTTRPEWVCQFLRNTFLRNRTNNTLEKKRIYVARETSTTDFFRRYVANEVEVLDFLEARGFKKYVLEKLSVHEQAELFASAEMIVAAHGSALTNLIFCSPGVKVAEVFLPFHLDSSFFDIGEQMGLNHYCILSEQEKLTEAQAINGDIYIPLDILAETLDL